MDLSRQTGRVDVNSEDCSGYTPLLYTAVNGHEAVVKLLLETGKADVDSKRRIGQTLLYAAGNGHEVVAKLLLETGRVDVNSEDSSGQTPLSYAARNGHKAVVKLLQSFKAT
jgi:ankyrin repeat protein